MTERFFRFQSSAITYTRNEEIAAWLLEQGQPVIEAWVSEMEKLARMQAQWGMMAGMRDEYSHIVDVLTLLRKKQGETVYEGE